MAIWQDLVEEYGYGASYESVKRFVRTIAPTRRAVGVFHGAPGADYGECRVMVSTRRGGVFRRLVVGASGISTSHNGYSASSQASRSLGGRRECRGGTVGVPADTRASRFISRSICT